MTKFVIDREYVARVLSVEIEVIRKWERLFSDYLTTGRSGLTDENRYFQQSDLYVFAFLISIKDWNDELNTDDFSDIHYSLNSQEHLTEKYIKFVYFNTPVFQELPINIDETYKNGVLFGGFTPRDSLYFADSYKLAGDTLIQSALESGTPYEYTYPILYNYRHAIEVYLKVVVRPVKLNHNLKELVEQFKQKYNKKLSEWAQNLLDQFHDIDEKSTTFRYGERLPNEEYWIDLHHLRTVMDVLSRSFKELAEQ
jgi:hypothetical protein